MTTLVHKRGFVQRGGGALGNTEYGCLPFKRESAQKCDRGAGAFDTRLLAGKQAEHTTDAWQPSSKRLPHTLHTQAHPFPTHERNAENGWGTKVTPTTHQRVADSMSPSKPRDKHNCLYDGAESAHLRSEVAQKTDNSVEGHFRSYVVQPFLRWSKPVTAENRQRIRQKGQGQK